MEITAPRHEADLAEYAALAHRAFATELTDLEILHTHGAIRLALDGQRVIGGVTALPVRQFFAGAALSSCCISTVCVAVDQRGRGVARRLLEHVAAEQKATGAVISSLWTPSLGLYRRWGWELAGSATTSQIPIDALTPTVRHDYQVAEVTKTAAHPLHRSLASAWHGPVDRPDWWWKWKYPDTPTGPQLYEISDLDGQARALVGYSPTRTGPWGHELEITDYWAQDPDAAGLANAFISNQRSQATTVRFQPGTLPPLAPYLWTADQYTATQHVWHPWMLKLLDPAGAIEQRPWPEAATGHLDLRLLGPAGTEQHLSFVIEAGKAATVTGRNPRLTLPASLFTSWYAGSISTEHLLQWGKADNVTKEHRLLLAAMSGSHHAWLPDRF
ncbi:GNAT family N-acetyltransferase [Streptomyces phaeochromogenes]|uniref:GNAT family N-acetyltransferase n=1 Tax=Streptomyces phaeochromogenes TaxID=1923 RepID=UPI002E2DAC7F|nr:GNAT family N-acetyltransferase [Streptomyces phaeochromogenes]